MQGDNHAFKVMGRGLWCARVIMPFPHLLGSGKGPYPFEKIVAFSYK